MQTGPNFKKALVSFVALSIGAFVLFYIFTGNDLIPDQLGLGFPQMLIGYMDDAIVVIIAAIAFRRMKIKAFSPKGKKKRDWVWMTVFGVLLTFALGYVFWGADLIPDSTPWFGFFDDVGAIFLSIGVATKIRQWIRKNR